MAQLQDLILIVLNQIFDKLFLLFSIFNFECALKVAITEYK